ncbi:hypothetical protein RhiJN_01197 [Ceratobasidium sp. AG-Ba]|nr:hypothetical protein RhiJN_01197 [Ceratobasidium sp. AG-Ba]QRW02226.1 hypothetical protein RhiLY_01223 [Ceratobasidium sp. AG-Ba]
MQLNFARFRIEGWLRDNGYPQKEEDFPPKKRGQWRNLVNRTDPWTETKWNKFIRNLTKFLEAETAGDRKSSLSIRRPSAFLKLPADVLAQ